MSACSWAQGGELGYSPLWEQGEGHALYIYGAEGYASTMSSVIAGLEEGCSVEGEGGEGVKR
jgi:hypothetical protein